MPERRLTELNYAHMQSVFRANTLGPALVLAHFSPLLARRERSVFATLSAKVGSIGDNRLGGWYSYRASKAALNMLVKTAAIEVARTHPHAVLCALHPGTVSDLRGPGPNIQPFDDLVIQTLLMKKQGDFIDTLHILGRDNRILFHITKKGYFGLDFRRQSLFGPAKQDIGLNTDASKFFDTVLSRFGFNFTRGLNMRDQGQMDIKDVFFPYIGLKLTNGLKKGKAFNIPHGAADLNNGHIGFIGHE